MDRIEMQIGEKGKTYGLRKPQNKLLSKPNVFKVDDEDDVSPIATTNKDIIKQSLFYKYKQNNDTYKALASDPTIFAYDSVHDTLQSNRDFLRKEGNKSKDARYQQSMKDHADFKKREKSIIKERIESLAREREKTLIGDTERFITPSYLKVLEENKKFEKVLDMEDKINLDKSIEGKSSLDTFYHKLLTKNKSLGAREQTPPVQKQVKLDEEQETSEEETQEQIAALRPEELKQLELLEQIKNKPEPQAPIVIEPLVKKSEEEVLSAKQRYLQRKQLNS